MTVVYVAATNCFFQQLWTGPPLLWANLHKHWQLGQPSLLVCLAIPDHLSLQIVCFTTGETKAKKPQDAAAT